MKNLVTLFFLLLVSVVSAQEIKIEKGKFYQNGVQISSYETKNLLKSNSEAYGYFKSAKTKEGVGGFLIGLGIGLTVGDVVKGLVSDADYPSGFTYVGAGCIAASIPVMIGRKKRLEKAIELYNNGLKSIGSTDFNMNILANNNGYGIQITF